MVKIVVGLLAILGLGSAKWDLDHQYSPENSGIIASAIKTKLLNSLSGFADQSFAAALKADLENKDDSKRALKQLTPLNAAQIFGALGLDDPHCDANGDGKIAGDELKCLNYAWKAYTPE